jgi:hypothetical protein
MIFGSRMAVLYIKPVRGYHPSFSANTAVMGVVIEALSGRKYE